MTDENVLETVEVGSAVRRLVHERAKENDGWTRLETFLQEVGNLDALIAAKKQALARLGNEERAAVERIEQRRSEAQQIKRDIDAEASRAEQAAKSTMAAADSVKAEADTVLKQAQSKAATIIAEAERKVADTLSGLRGIGKAAAE